MTLNYIVKVYLFQLHAISVHRLIAAYLFLFCYEQNFMFSLSLSLSLSLSAETEVTVLRYFISISRYLDDLLTFDNIYLEEMIDTETFLNNSSLIKQILLIQKLHCWI